MSVIPAMARDAGVEGQAAIEAEAEDVIEAVRIGLTTAISIGLGGRHRARPALALTLLMT